MHRRTLIIKTSRIQVQTDTHQIFFSMEFTDYNHPQNR